MVKVIITYRCGHSEETEINPPMKNFHGKMKRNYFDGWQEWRITQLEKELCPICYEKDKKREWDNSAHKEENRLSRNKKVYDMEKEVNKILSIDSSKFWIEERTSLENVENIIKNAEAWLKKYE